MSLIGQSACETRRPAKRLAAHLRNFGGAEGTRSRLPRDFGGGRAPEQAGAAICLRIPHRPGSPAADRCGIEPALWSVSRARGILPSVREPGV